MWGCLEFMIQASNWIALKWTMRSQTMACIAKSSCVDRRQKKLLVTWQNLLFSDLVHQLIFFKETRHFRSQLRFRLWAKKHLTQWLS